MNEETEKLQKELILSEIRYSRLKVIEAEKRIKFLIGSWEKARRILICIELAAWPVITAYLIKHW